MKVFGTPIHAAMLSSVHLYCNVLLAVRAAADLSNRADAELHVIHVRKPLPVQSSLSRPAYFDRVFEEYTDLYEEETELLMRRQVFRAKAEGADVSDAHLREGRAAEEITGLARELAADLVVVGSRGAGPLERLVKGSPSASSTTRRVGRSTASYAKRTRARAT